MVGLRELNVDGIPEHNWINDHFKYTHGYGIVAASGTVGHRHRRAVVHRVRPARPRASSAPTSRGSTTARRPSSTRSSAARTKETRLLRRSPARRATRYTGKSGVSLSSALTRAAYAVQLRRAADPLLRRHRQGVADPVQPHAQGARRGGRALADHRRRPVPGGGRRPHPVDRRRLHHDQRLPVRLAHDARRHHHRLADRPASARCVAQQNQVNYIRNSVKATVDAYDGTVKLYQWDTKDPVLQDLDEGVPRHGASRSRDISPAAAGPPALPAGPVQGAARAADPLPRDRRRDRSTAAATPGRCRTTRDQGDGERGAAVLPEPEDAGPERARRSR